MDETEATVLRDDIVREILLRVPTDEVAALFRCALTCKQWRGVVADLSFLRHHWSENACHPSSLLGFFETRFRNHGMPFFFPISPRSVLGPRCRPLASFIPSAPPGGILDDAVPLAARGGLLLVHLGGAVPLAGDSLRLAVCGILTGTCDVLPPLECTVYQCGCAILAREDCCFLDGQQGRTPSTGYSAFFKVLALVSGSNPDDCNLYTISSSKSNWSRPKKCFDEVLQRDKYYIQIMIGVPNRVILCHGVAYWLGLYSTGLWNLPRYFTIGVNVETSQISLTELSIPAYQLAPDNHFGIMLTAGIDGKLFLFHLQKEGLRLNTWTCGNDGTWIRTRVVELKPPEKAWNPLHVAMLSSGEKSGALFMADLFGHVHKTDPVTGVMEDVTPEIFQDSLGTMAVPIEIDWPTLFMSRLAV